MKRKLALLLSICLLMASLAGCAQAPAEPAPAEEPAAETPAEETPVTEEPEVPQFENKYPEFIINETEDSITYIDLFGTETTVAKNPKKVVIGFNSILGLWYFSGGESITKAKGSTNVPEEAMENVDIGSSYDMGLETVLAFEPDLVILAGNVSPQVELAPILKESGIDVMIVDTKNNAFERFQENAYLFSKINGTEEKYEENMMPILEEIGTIVEKANEVESKPEIAAMFASSKSISLESDKALTGEMIHALGGNNILDSQDVLAEGETRVPFSIEALITDNPEIIMISTMGSVDSVKENVGKMIEENPAWHEIDAVKNGKVYYLPKEYSVYKPNEKYAEAFLYIAKLMYPDTFGAE